MKRLTSFGILSISVIAMTMMGAGCNSRDADNLQTDAQNLARDAGHAAVSLKLAASVKTVLMLRKGVDASDMHIDSKDDVVTLSGAVSSEAEHKLVISTVNGIKGVGKVVDELKVSPASKK